MAFSIPGLSQILSQITGSLAARDSESVVGVDIGTSSIKVVQLAQQKGVAVLETYGEIALGPYGNGEVGQSVNPPAEKTGEALNDLIREANVTAKSAGFGIPLSGSLISVITLPTKNREDLKTMVPLEARKYIPVPISEVSLDWFEIPEEEAQFLGAQGVPRNINATDVLLVAIHNQTLSKFEAVTGSTKLIPKFYEVEPFSMARSAYQHGTAPTMVMDFGASSTRVFIIEFGIIDVSHTIPKGGQDFTRAVSQSQGLTFTEAEMKKREKGLTDNTVGEASLDFIFSEARRILLTYQRKEGKAISEVVFVGGGAELKGITEVAARYFDARVTLSTPFDKVSAPAFIDGVLKEAGPSFAAAVGLALRGLQK